MRDRSGNSYSLLMVEDNSGDVLLARKALSDSAFSVDIQVIEDGREAIEFLRKTASTPHARLPDLVLLDLTLVKMDGYEVLKEIKGDERLRSIPVVIFTGSGSPDEVRRAYDLGANAYIRKPMGFKEMVRMLGALENFWFGTAELPGKA